MKRAIILHGRPSRREYLEIDFPSPSNAHWLPWLQQQLLRHGVLAQTPEVYKPYAPAYQNWAEQINRFGPDDQTIMVGHSCGAGMIVQWLSKNPQARVGKVVLVAPWIDVEKDDWPAFDFTIDPDMASRTAGLTIFHSTNDAEEIQTSVRELRRILKGVDYMEFPDYGHFTIGSMKTVEFPQLLDECLGDPAGLAVEQP